MIAKRIILISLLLLCVRAAGLAQTVTVAPDTRYNAALVPGSVCIATLEGGQLFTFGTVFRGNGLFKVLTVPAGAELRNIQIWQNKWMFAVNVASLDNVTGLRFLWPGHDVVVALGGSNTPAPAKPTITATGRYSSDEFPGSGIAFDGVIDFGNSSMIQVALFGSDFGSISAWIVRLSGVDAAGNFIVVEARAQAHGLSQAHPPLLQFGLGRSLVGSVQVQARAADNPAIQSNVVTMVVE